MKWRSLIIAASLFLIGFLTACSSGSDSQGSTAVTVAIGSGKGSAKPSKMARSKAVPEVVSIRITISARDMDTITSLIPVTPSQTVSQTFYILNGPGRTFLIEALDAGGNGSNIVYSGSSTADLNGTPVTLTVPLQAMFLGNLIWTPWNDEATSIANAQDGNLGNMIIAGHTFGDLGGTNADPTHNTPDVFVSKLDPTGATIWTQQYGTSAFDLCYSVTTDTAGNIYIAGSTAGDLNNELRTGIADAFVMKLDASGAHLWTRLTGTTNSDTFGNALAVDAAGNVYVTGNTDGGLPNNTSAGWNDVFITKYDTNGNLQWIRQNGSAEDDYGYGIVLDAAGNNLYISGSTHGGLQSSPTGTNFSNNGPGTTTDIFLMHYDAAGLWQLTQQLGTPDNDDAWAIAIDPMGSVYVAGSTSGDLISAVTGTSPLGTYSGLNDIFVAKFDAVLNISTSGWPQQFGTVGNDVASGMVYDPNGGYVVVTGQTSGDMDGLGNAGFDDMFMVRYDPSGIWQETQQFGTKANDAGAGVVTDGNGLITVMGNTYGGFTSSATEDIFLQQYPYQVP